MNNVHLVTQEKNESKRIENGPSAPIALPKASPRAQAARPALRPCACRAPAARPARYCLPSARPAIITIDYVKSKDNIADPLTKDLTREMVAKTSRGMGLRPLNKLS